MENSELKLMNKLKNNYTCDNENDNDNDDESYTEEKPQNKS